MSQILLWTSFAEIFGGIALFQTIQGKRAPGDFKFDPLGLSSVRSATKLYSKVLVQKWPVNLMHHFLILHDFTMLQGKNEKNLERYQLAEIKHGRLAMIAFSGFVHQVGPFPACCGFSPYLCSNSLGKSTRKARRKAPQPQHCNKAIRTGIGVSNQYNTKSSLL